ncbi:hypothetical protein KGY79_01745 [Candidatus Bipolaricaulota bacterium]|nr:hypothetical protein [Candidatus Bipolaricaulota bacterium]
MEEKSKILVISLAIALVILPVVTAVAQDDTETLESSSGSIFNFGTDAKSLAMGGAFVAVADNYSATYWNPAGLTQFSGVQLGGMNLQPYGVNGLNFSYGGGAVTIQDFAIGASYGQLTASMTDQLGYADTEFSDYSETTIGGTFAYGINFANFGANVKSYQFKGDSGFGFDLGTLMTFDGINLGIAANNVGGVSISDNSTVDPSYRLGVSAELLELAIASAEVDLQGDSRVIKAGFEILPIDQFALRGGVQVPSSGGPSFTVGAGINLAGLTVDIAWLQNNTEFAGRSGAGDTLVLSAGFQFGAFGESA